MARGTCHVPMCKSLQKKCSQGCRSNQWTVTTPTLRADGHHKETKRLGIQWCCPLGTCHRHVPSDFINSFIAPERLVRSGRGRCHSTQFNDRNIGKPIAPLSVPCATCHWHVVRDLTNLVNAAERLIRFGRDRRHSTQGKRRKSG